MSFEKKRKTNGNIAYVDNTSLFEDDDLTLLPLSFPRPHPLQTLEQPPVSSSLPNSPTTGSLPDVHSNVLDAFDTLDAPGLTTSILMGPEADPSSLLNVNANSMPPLSLSPVDPTPQLPVPVLSVSPVLVDSSTAPPDVPPPIVAPIAQDHDSSSVQLMTAMMKSIHEMQQQIGSLASQLETLTSRAIVPPPLSDAPALPVTIAIPTPCWGVYSESQSMKYPDLSLYLLPEWRSRRFENPEKFTMERCDPRIKVAFSGYHSMGTLGVPACVSITSDHMGPRLVTLSILDTNAKGAHVRVEQAASILYKTFQGLSKASFASLIKSPNVTTIIGVDNVDSKVISVCIMRTVDLDVDNCIGMGGDTDATPFVVCILYLATNRLYQNHGISRRIISIIKDYVNTTRHSMIAVQSAYMAVDFWQKHASHTRLSINTIHSLYLFDKDNFDICKDTVEFAYVSIA